MTDTIVSDNPNKNPSKWRLTNVVKQFLDILYALSLLGFFMMIIFTLIVGLNIPSEPSERHTDINFHFNFVVYPENIEGVKEYSIKAATEYADAPSEVIRGDGVIKLNNTKSHMAWYISNVITIVFIILGLFAIRILQKLFKNLDSEHQFHGDNPHYLKQFGYIVIAWSIIEPLFIYFGGMVILSDVGQHATNLDIYPAFYLNIEGIFIGLAILILAQIMKEATQMREEQELTI